MVWNPGKMVPGMPSMPGPNPQSCTIYCSRSRALGPWGCLGHFQEAQRGQNQAQSAQECLNEVYHNINNIVDLSLVKSIEGLSLIGLQCFHCILTELVMNLWW